MDAEENLSELDPIKLAKLITTLAQVDELASRRQRLVRAGAGRGSQAERDLQLPEGQFVLVFATQALAFAIDHLKSWQLLVFGGLHPTFSQMTLVRGALEGAVTCRWLVDPHAAANSRVARGVAAALDDYNERRKFELAVNMPTPPDDGPDKTAEARIADLTGSRAAAGLPIVRYPTTTWLMEHFGNQQDTVWLYRLVSAFAHAKQWSLAGTDRSPRALRRPVPGVEGGAVEASDQIVLYATVRAFELVDVALAETEEYGRKRSLIGRFVTRRRSRRRP